MSNLLYQHDIISTKDLTLDQIELVLDTAAQIKKKPLKNSLQNKIIAHCFFEPSTRTRLSFETATLRLGGQVIGFSSGETTSTKKGESLHDAIKVIGEYADLIVIRHHQQGAARLAADITPKPIINAGDAANQHPTQTLVDLFTMRESQGKLENLNIALVGDLKYGRTIHSFVQICSLFNFRLYLIAPEVLMLPEHLCDMLKKSGVRFSFHHSMEEVMPKLDILYMTRIQQERFNESEFHLLSKQYTLTPASLQKAKSNLKVMHPLPRVGEISHEVDQTPHAHYFAQAANGVPVRQALLTLLLNK